MPRLSKIGAAALAAFGWTGISSVSASYLVVAGGGGGGKRIAGAGGAGGLLTGTASLNPTLSYTITVGAGGAGSSNYNSAGTNGSDSIFNTATSIGGGGGAGSGIKNGVNGGSGGGSADVGTVGTGTVGQGNNGGVGSGNSPNYGGGGGGGASAVGGNGSATVAGNGGAGTASSISGSSVTYAGGGGGGSYGGTAGSGGAGGGGAGTTSDSTATAGTANLGGGGGGCGGISTATGTTFGGQGGSGVVIISYVGAQQFSGGVVTSSGGNTIHTFTTSGTLGPVTPLSANYLVVAGGGAGGTDRSGGGGAGGLLSGSGLTIDPYSTYLVTVGAGATGVASTSTIVSGSNSSFSMVATAAVGGGGGASSASINGASGGSGGGGNQANGTGGAGTSGQGNAGGAGGPLSSPYAGGGGGGAGAAGAAGNQSTGGGAGGVGIASSISGTSTYYAGGGGGGAYNIAAGAGGNGGGGAGSNSGSGTAGTANTGGGGGGTTAAVVAGGNGGSGVVIISYAGSTQLMAGGVVTIAGGNVIHTFNSSGYLTPLTLVTNSLRFRQSASAYLNRTASNAPTSNQKGTFSFWFKRGSLATGSEQWLFAGGSNSMGCGFPTNNVMFMEYFGGLYLYTTQVFRDPSAWYHMTFAIDTTQATAANRAKLYINGVQVTSFTTEQYPSQNATFNWMASGQACYINQIYAGGRYFDGYMAEFNYIDGQQLAPTAFGTFNSYGVWQPITYGGSYGTNGFRLPFTNNASTTTLGYDFSPQGNNWTTNNINLTTADSTVTFTSSGTWTVPSGVTSSFVVKLWGGGGGGGGGGSTYGNNGSAGNATTFNGISAGGGAGGTGAWTANPTGTSGAGGTASGGDTNTSGNSIATTNGATQGAGAPNGGGNTAVATGNAEHYPGTFPGGAATGGRWAGSGNPTGGAGGSGAYALKTYAGGTLTAGATYTVTVGAGGAGGSSDADSGATGASGAVTITYNNGGVATTYDSMTDVPTLTSATAANTATFNPLAYVGTVATNGNLTATATGTAGGCYMIGTMGAYAIKTYFEVTVVSDNQTATEIGVTSVTNGATSNIRSNSISYVITGSKNVLGTGSAYGASYTNGSVIGVAVDGINGTITFYRDNVSQGVITNSFISANTTLPAYVFYASGGSGSVVLNCGQQPFTYTPPTGYLALNTFNL